MKNIVHKVALFAAGVYSLSREKVEQFVDDLREEGEITEEEGRQLVEDLWGRTKEAEKSIEEKVKFAVQKARESVPLDTYATKEDLDKLEQRVKKLEG